MSQALTDLQTAVTKLTTDVDTLINTAANSVSSADIETQVTALNTLDAAVVAQNGQ